MSDLDFSLGIETSIDGSVMPPSQAEVESQVLSDFTQAGRFGELQTDAGVASFDAAVQERLNASRAALSGGQVPYPSPAAPRLDASLSSVGTDLVHGGFMPSRQMLTDAGLAPGFSGGGGYGAPPIFRPPGGGGGFGGDDFEGDYGFSGQSVNARWRQWHRDQQRAQDIYDNMTGVEEAQYADILDVPGRVGPAGWRGRLGEMFSREVMTSTDMQFALGFGAMTTASGLQRALSPLVSGEAYLPGQVAEQSATATLPLLGAIGGTVAGARFGQPLAGQFIGQAVGTTAENLIDTFQTGHTFAQQMAGESLAVGRGGKAAAEEFADALRNVVTPAAKELAEAFQRLGQSGPVATTGAAGLAPFQTEFGTAFSATVAAEGRSLESSPFLAPLRLRFGTNAAGIPGSDFLGAAGLMAYTGDYSGLLSNVGFAQATAGRDVENPAWRRDRDFVDRYSRNAGVWQDAKDLFTWDGGQQAAYEAAQDRLGNTGPGGAHVPGTGEAQFLTRQDRAKAAQISTAATDLQSAYEAHQANEAALQLSGATLGADVGGLQLSLLRGGGAAALDAALPGVLSQVSAGGAALGRDIAGLRRIERTSPALGGYAETLIQQAAARRTALETEGAQIGRLGVTTGLQERESAFRLGNLRDTLHGLSNAEQSPGDTAYYRGLVTESRSLPFLSPSERDAMEATGLQGAYQTRVGVYAQTLSQIDARLDRGQTDIARQQIYGGPQDVFNAGQGVADAFTAKIRELTDEMHRGGLTLDDSIAKERQLTEARRSSAQFDFQRQEGRFEGQASVIGTDIATASVGLSRTLARGGNAALDPSLLSLGLSAQTTAQSKLDFDRRHYPGNEQLLASDRLGVAQAQEARNQALDIYNPYHPTGDFSRRLMNDEAALQMSRLLPFSDGVDPLTANRRLTADYRQDLSGLDANRAARQKSGLWRDEDETRYTQQRNADRLGIAGLERGQQTAWLSMLPETMAGMPLAPGVGSAIIPRASEAALYGPSGVNGSFRGVMGGLMPHGWGAGAAAHALASAHGIAPAPYHPLAIRPGYDAAGHPHSEGYLAHAGIDVDATGRPHSRMDGGLLNAPHSDLSGHLLNAPHPAAMDLTTGHSVGLAGLASVSFAPPRPQALITHGATSGSGSMSMSGMSSSASPHNRVEDLLQQAVQELRALNRNGAKFSATTPGNTVGAAVQISNQSRNPYTGK